MDPITHGLLGATLAQTFTSKKLKQHAWRVGALAAMAPDLDIFIRSSTNPLLSYIYHRNFTHSLAFIVMGGLIVGLIYLLLFKSSRVQKGWVLLTAIIGYSTHGLLDATASYGTMLLWPFSHVRIAWDTMAIVEPMVTLILLITVIWSVRRHSQKIAAIGLLITGIYFSFGILQHHRGIAAQTQYAA